MAMSESTLATELENLAPTSTESEAAQTLTDAYGVYAAGAIAGGVPITSAGVDLGKAAMLPALAGMSADGAGITIIPSAVVAFWNGVAGGLSTSFVGATAITPPPHATLPSAFASLMPTNTSGDVTKAEAAASIAEIMHADAIVGGTVTYPGGTFPIL